MHGASPLTPAHANACERASLSPPKVTHQRAPGARRAVWLLQVLGQGRGEGVVHGHVPAPPHHVAWGSQAREAPSQGPRSACCARPPLAGRSPLLLLVKLKHGEVRHPQQRVLLFRAPARSVHEQVRVDVHSVAPGTPADAALRATEHHRRSLVGGGRAAGARHQPQHLGGGQVLAHAVQRPGHHGARARRQQQQVAGRRAARAHQPRHLHEQRATHGRPGAVCVCVCVGVWDSASVWTPRRGRSPTTGRIRCVRDAGARLPRPTAPLAPWPSHLRTCSCVSPSLMGLAQSTSPPSSTRMKARPAAPPATASLAMSPCGHAHPHPHHTSAVRLPASRQQRGLCTRGSAPPLLQRTFGLMRELLTRLPSGTRMALTHPPASTAPANTLQRGAHTPRKQAPGLLSKASPPSLCCPGGAPPAVCSPERCPKVSELT